MNTHDDRPSLAFVEAVVSRLEFSAEMSATAVTADLPLMVNGQAYRIHYDASADALILVTDVEWRRRLDMAREAVKRRQAEIGRLCRPREDWNA